MELSRYLQNKPRVSSHEDDFPSFSDCQESVEYFNLLSQSNGLAIDCQVNHSFKNSAHFSSTTKFCRATISAAGRDWLQRATFIS